MTWHFWKMHGLGNDYLYLDVRTLPPMSPDWPAIAVRLCDRHFGVGADGVILIGRSVRGDAKMTIYNADGSRAEMCGNGLRCLAKWLYDRRQAGRRQTIETDAGLLFPEVIDTDGTRASRIRVNMGIPVFSAAQCGLKDGEDVPFLARPITVAGQSWKGSLVSLGNPHLVILDAWWDDPTLYRIGPALERHAWFPGRINAHCVQVDDAHHLRMRHWERGAGPTLACGTGAAGAAAVAMRLGRVASPVQVGVPGGVLEVEWDGGETSALYLTGPAREVFSGDWSGNAAD